MTRGTSAARRHKRGLEEPLVDCLESGDTLDEFLHQFPSVTLERAVAALKLVLV